MTEMYQRKVDTGATGITVSWNPEDQDAAAQALADVARAPPASKSDALDNCPVDLSQIGDEVEQSNVGREVRQAYDEIIKSTA